MAVHAAAEVLPEEHGAHLRSLHLHPPQAAGLRGQGPGRTGVRALQPPGHAGGLQEKVSLLWLHPARDPKESYVNNPGLGLSIHKKFQGNLKLGSQLVEH